MGLGGEVVARDVGTFLEQSPEMFDVVFVDPPYALELASVEEIMELVAAAVSPGGTVVLHRPDGEAEPMAPEGLKKIDDRRYGGTRLWRYERNMP